MCEMSRSAKENGASSAERPAKAVSHALVRFRQGELSLKEYLETRVEAAVEHLRGRVSGERLEMVKDVVRESLSSDPITAEYVRRLTGPRPARSADSE